MLTYTSIHILVTEMLKSEPVEPTDTIELKPYVKFVVEPKENQGKQLSMISFSYVLCLGIYGLCAMYYVYSSHCCTHFYALPFLELFIHILVTR